MNEAQPGHVTAPERIHLRRGPLRPRNDNESIDGAPEFVHDILPATTPVLPGKGRKGFFGIVFVIAGGVAAILSQGCNDPRPEDQRKKEARHLEGQRSRLQAYGVTIDCAGRMITIEPEGRASRTQRRHPLPPGASVPVIDEIADPQGGPGARQLRIRYGTDRHDHTIIVSASREYAYTAQEVPMAHASPSATRP